MLQKRAFVFNNSEEISEALNEYIRTGIVTGYENNVNDSDFIVRYGTDINNHRSSERAINTLVKLASQKR